MTDAQEAHLRLMAKLREQTRTHECQDDAPLRGRKYSPADRQTLKEQLKACFSLGLNRKQAAEACRCSTNTIARMFGRLYKRPRRRNARPR